MSLTSNKTTNKRNKKNVSTAANTLSKREKNRKQRRARALDAALKVFAEFGYAGSSMDSIASEAGLTKPTLYQYFPSKAELFREMMLAPRNVMLMAFEHSSKNEPDECHVAQLHAFSWSYARTVMRKDFLALARLVIGDAQRNPDFGLDYQASGPDKVLADLADFMQSQADLGRLEIEDAIMAAEDFWGLILSVPRNRALHIPDAYNDFSQLRKYVHNGLKVFLKAYSTDPVTDLKRLAAIIKKDKSHGKIR